MSRGSVLSLDAGGKKGLLAVSDAVMQELGLRGQVREWFCKSMLPWTKVVILVIFQLNGIPLLLD